MRKLIIVALIIFSCVVESCSSKRGTTIERTVSDSITTSKTVRLRDTTIVAPSSSVQVKTPVFELNEKPLVKKSGNATITLSKDKDNILTARADCDSLQLQVQLRDSIISTLQKRFESEKITTPPPQEKDGWIKSIIQSIGFILLLILAGFGVLYLITNFKKK